MAVKKSKLLQRIIILAFFIIALAFLVFNENGVLKYVKLRNEINKLDNEIKKTELRLQSLREEIDSLNTKKEKIEKVARERYNMMLPNENALRVEEK
jgi:cell division protein FtsL